MVISVPVLSRFILGMRLQTMWFQIPKNRFFVLELRCEMIENFLFALAY